MLSLTKSLAVFKFRGLVSSSHLSYDREILEDSQNLEINFLARLFIGYYGSPRGVETHHFSQPRGLDSIE